MLNHTFPHLQGISHTPDSSDPRSGLVARQQAAFTAARRVSSTHLRLELGAPDPSNLIPPRPKKLIQPNPTNAMGEYGP
jgi:hypothetical protein